MVWDCSAGPMGKGGGWLAAAADPYTRPCQGDSTWVKSENVRPILGHKTFRGCLGGGGILSLDDGFVVRMITEIRLGLQMQYCTERKLSFCHMVDEVVETLVIWLPTHNLPDL